MRYIMRIMIASLMVAGVLLPAASVADAQSLWGPNHGLFADRKASQVGDILTIVINESTTTSTAKNTSNSKSGAQNLSAGTGIFHFLAAATASQSDKFTAAGSANSTNTVNGMVTVTVVEVQPNGNLVVEGTQSIWQNNNEHKITLHGIVRPDDISYNNTIMSSKVSDATLKFDGKGPLNAKQRQGIITQILNFLF